ncbi:hypothetical protein Tco_0772029 [Tanacetum coccineum]|uniref:Uncharacterized protein n=1 Tax=Tanacetum coccineum TaxID=301880 RepID=A0ABQ4ZKR0_9ASTR
MAMAEDGRVVTKAGIETRTGRQNGWDLFNKPDSPFPLLIGMLSLKDGANVEVLLLRHKTRDFVPDLSIDIPASPEYIFGLGRAGLSEVISYVSPSEAPG